MQKSPVKRTILFILNFPFGFLLAIAVGGMMFGAPSSFYRTPLLVAIIGGYAFVQLKSIAKNTKVVTPALENFYWLLVSFAFVVFPIWFYVERL